MRQWFFIDTGSLMQKLNTDAGVTGRVCLKKFWFLFLHIRYSELVYSTSFCRGFCSTAGSEHCCFAAWGSSSKLQISCGLHQAPGSLCTHSTLRASCRDAWRCHRHTSRGGFCVFLDQGHWRAFIWCFYPKCSKLCLSFTHNNANEPPCKKKKKKGMAGTQHCNEWTTRYTCQPLNEK